VSQIDETSSDHEDLLQPSMVEPLASDAQFLGLDASVEEFWRWAFSDLRENVIRGVLAEFVVARAVGARQPVRVAWDNYDVISPEGIRIEVKSSAYLQSWAQKRHSKLSFGHLSGREFDQTTGEYGADRAFRADVFVFAVQNQQDPAGYDGLDMNCWEFYSVPGETVRQNAARSVGIGWVKRQAGEPVGVDELAAAIRTAAPKIT
jgi:hypothetical protein